MKIAPHYSFVEEHPNTFELHDSRDGSRFHVPKGAIPAPLHSEIKDIPHYDDGTDSVPDFKKVDAETNAGPVVGEDLPTPNSAKFRSDFLSKDYSPGSGSGRVAQIDNLLQDTNNYPTGSPQRNALIDEQSRYDAGSSVNNPTANVPPPQQLQASLNPVPVIPAGQPLAGTEASANPNGVPAEAPVQNNSQPDPNAGLQGITPDVNVKNVQDMTSKMAVAQQMGIDAQKTYLQHSQDLQNHYLSQADEAYKGVMAGQVDPNHYFNSKSSLGKMGTGLGIILGGMGAHATGGHNEALDFVNKQISNDIDAQKNNISNKQSLYNMNLQAFKDVGTATTATVATQQAITAAQLEKIKTQNPMMAQQISIAQQGLINQSRLGYMDVAKQTAMMNMWKQAGGTAVAGTEDHYLNRMNTMQYISPEIYKDMQSKFVGGMGAAQVPLTLEDKKELENYQNIVDLSKQAKQFRENQSGGMGSWAPETKAQGRVLQGQLISALTQLKDSNRPESKEFYDRAVEQVGDLNSTDLMGGNLSGLRTLQKVANDKLNILKNQRRITAFNSPGNSTTAMTANPVAQYVAWAKANPNNPKAQLLLQKVGAK